MSEDLPAGFVLDDDMPEGFVLDEPSVLDQIEQSTPYKVAAESAAGINRTMFDLIDFLGPDNVNAALQVMGSEQRVPTMGETFGAENFMEPGLLRDVVKTGSETVPAALVGGQLARTAIGRLPLEKAGESVVRGATRMLASTPADDIAAGALSGAGAELGGAAGELVGQEEVGRMVGAFGLPLVSALFPSAVKSNINAAAPTDEMLSAKKSALYKQVDDLGITVKSDALQKLVNSIRKDLEGLGLRTKLTPKAYDALEEFTKDAAGDMTPSQIDAIRRLAGIAAKSADNPQERMLGGVFINRIDDFMDDLAVDMFNGPEVNAGQVLKQARGLVQRIKKNNRIEEAIKLAEERRSSIDVALAGEFSKIKREIIKGKLRGFTKDEIKAIDRVSKGETGERAIRGLAKLGLGDGQAWQVFGPAAGAYIGSQVAGPWGAAGVVAAGQAAKSIASRMTAKNAELAGALVRAGKNARQITGAYLKNVPKSQQSVDDLTALLISQNAEGLMALRSSARPIVANAGYWASVIKNQPNQVSDADNTESAEPR